LPEDDLRPNLNRKASNIDRLAESLALVLFVNEKVTQTQRDVMAHFEKFRTRSNEPKTLIPVLLGENSGQNESLDSTLWDYNVIRSDTSVEFENVENTNPLVDNIVSRLNRLDADSKDN